MTLIWSEFWLAELDELMPVLGLAFVKCVGGAILTLMPAVGFGLDIRKFTECSMLFLVISRA